MNLAKDYLEKNGYEDGMCWDLNNISNIMNDFAEQECKRAVLDELEEEGLSFIGEK